MDIQQLVELRIKIEPPPDLQIARPFFTTIYETLYRSCQYVQDLHHDNQLIAFIILSTPQQMRFGNPEPVVTVLIDPDFPHAKDWAAQTLKEMSPHFGLSCALEIFAHDMELLPILNQIGFCISKVDLIGSVDTALQLLQGKTVLPQKCGVRFAPLAIEQVAEVNQMINDFFVAHPEFGWGGQAVSAEDQQKLNLREEKRMMRQVQEYPGSDFVIHKQDKIVGSFGFIPNPGNPLFGNCGGVNIILLPEIQKMGLGKSAYQHLLLAMQKMELDLFVGRTSNPGVLKIGHQIGRRARRYLLRKEGPFLSNAFVSSLF